MTERPAPRRLASRLSAFAVGAALVAALLVPMIVMVLAGSALDARAIDGHAAGDAAGAASAAVGGAQRLLTGGREATPVALPACQHAAFNSSDACAAIASIFEPAPRRLASGDAAATAEAARRF